jgi:hypothetical protein
MLHLPKQLPISRIPVNKTVLQEMYQTELVHRAELALHKAKCKVAAWAEAEHFMNFQLTKKEVK